MVSITFRTRLQLSNVAYRLLRYFCLFHICTACLMIISAVNHDLTSDEGGRPFSSDFSIGQFSCISGLNFVSMDSLYRDRPSDLHIVVSHWRSCCEALARFALFARRRKRKKCSSPCWNLTMRKSKSTSPWLTQSNRVTPHRPLVSTTPCWILVNSKCASLLDTQRTNWIRCSDMWPFLVCERW